LCRIHGLHNASSGSLKRDLHSTDDGTESHNISFIMVASVDARTLPLVMLQSSHVCLAVNDVSMHPADNSHSTSDDGKMNSTDADITFEQLMIHLAQLQRMLVSAMAIV